VQEFFSFTFGNGPRSESKNRKCVCNSKKLSYKERRKKYPVDLDSSFLEVSRTKMKQFQCFISF